MKTTTKQPLVSVIMNCYNGEKYLAEALESVLNQTYKNFEIIFWDNISTDKSANIVASYNDDRIKYFLADTHTPLGEARNGALQKVKGAYIAFLDVDDLWLAEKLEKQIPFFEDTSVGLVYSLTNNINYLGKDINNLLVNNRSFEDRISFVSLFKNYNIVFSSAIITKEALNYAGGYFDNLLRHAEEYDLFLRICSKYKAIKINHILAKYRIHQTQETLKNFSLSIYESEYIISKMRLLYPQIFIDNLELFRIREKNAAWQSYLNFILKKETRQARKKLCPFIFESSKYFIFYFLSFLGSNIIIALWNKERNKKGKYPVIS